MRFMKKYFWAFLFMLFGLFLISEDKPNGINKFISPKTATPSISTNKQPDIIPGKVDESENLALIIEPLRSNKSFTTYAPDNSFMSIGLISLEKNFGWDVKLHPFLCNKSGFEMIGILQYSRQPRLFYIVAKPLFEPDRTRLYLIGIVLLEKEKKDFRLVSANDTYVVFANSKNERIAKKIRPVKGEPNTISYSDLRKRDKESQLLVIYNR